LLALFCALVFSCAPGTYETPGGSANGAQKSETAPGQRNDITFPAIPLPDREKFTPSKSGRNYTKVEQLSFAKNTLDIQPDVHPGGEKLVFARITKELRPCIYLKPLHGYAATMLTPTSSSAAWPRFSPDGKRIAFASNRNGNWDVYIIALQTPHAVQQVTMGQAQEVGPSWSPDGKNIIYSALIGGAWEMTIINLDSMNQLWIGPGLFPEWSPDGSKIAYQHVEQGPPVKYSIWTVDIDYNADAHTVRHVGSPTKIVSDADFSACFPTWSPDSTKIAFTSVPNNWTATNPVTALVGTDIWTVKSDGTVLVNLTNSDLHCWDPVWTEDRTGQQRIIFTTHKREGYNVWSVEPGADY
jgi:Tol biopolymer transport system component